MAAAGADAHKRAAARGPMTSADLHAQAAEFVRLATEEETKAKMEAKTAADDDNE